MTLHLIKLAVGAESVADLSAWQGERLKELKRKGKKPEMVHVTRQMPKRADEILDGGSLYWVIGGWIAARQRILELRPMVKDGVPHCGIVYDKTVIKVRNRQHRPFQGWRYLESENAPTDLVKGESDTADMPPDMRRELAALGLI